MRVASRACVTVAVVVLQFTFRRDCVTNESLLAAIQSMERTEKHCEKHCVNAATSASQTHRSVNDRLDGALRSVNTTIRATHAFCTDAFEPCRSSAAAG